MSSRLIENILEAEATAEEMRDESIYLIPGNLSDFPSLLEPLEPGRIIKLPKGMPLGIAMLKIGLKRWDFPYF